MFLRACLLLLLCASCVLEDQPVNPDGGLGGEGGGAGGTGGTGGSPCGTCSGEEPACDEASGTCVQCTEQNTEACAGATSLCDSERFICVQCLRDADCADPTAPRCDTNGECADCQTRADCTRFDDLPECNGGGACVECTPGTELESCDGDSCNPATFTCTGTPVGSRATCETCVSDSDCAEPDNRCVAMEYQGSPYPDAQTGFCLKTAEGGCERPFAITLSDRESFSGPPEEDYCGINESLATCEAVRALLQDARCDSGEDEECPQPSGICRQVGSLPNRCSYRCESVVECLEDRPPGRPGSTCGGGVISEGPYCGGVL